MPNNRSRHAAAAIAFALSTGSITAADAQTQLDSTYAAWARTTFPAEEFANRRSRLLDLARTGGGVVLVPSASGATGGETFRQRDDFLYLSGLELPRSLLWIDADSGLVRLYLPDHDPRWENPTRPNDFPGRPLGADPDLRAQTGLANLVSTDRLDAAVTALARSGRRVRVDGGGSAPAPLSILSSGGGTPERELALALAARPDRLKVDDAHEIFARLRMIKSPREIAAIQRAVDAAVEAMLAAIAQVRPGMTERALIGTFESACRRQGAQRFPFTPIIKSGPNALWPWRILASHYDRRDRPVAQGDLVIFDVGCEIDYYVSDIGRSVPVGGQFSFEQRKAVQMVTEVSDSIIAAIRPGVTFGALLEVAYRTIPDWARPFMQTGSFFGHHIGLDSGDPSLLDAPLEPGMVFTVEPWYYNHTEGVAAFVEDNVVVTASGVRVLSRALPRSAADLERLARLTP